MGEKLGSWKIRVRKTGKNLKHLDLGASVNNGESSSPFACAFYEFFLERVLNALRRKRRGRRGRRRRRKGGRRRQEKKEERTRKGFLFPAVSTLSSKESR